MSGELILTLLLVLLVIGGFKTLQRNFFVAILLFTVLPTVWIIWAFIEFFRK